MRLKSLKFSAAFCPLVFYFSFFKCSSGSILERSTEDLECYHLENLYSIFSLLNQVNSTSCIKYWQTRDCKGDELDTIMNIGLAGSISGCSRCNINNNTNGYQCAGSGRCIKLRDICNGWKDCVNGDDEMGCGVPTKFTCNRTVRGTTKTVMGYQCQNDSADQEECTYRSFVCDGKKDCKSGSDERDCDLVRSFGCITFNGNIGFQCHVDNNKCIPRSLVCDGNEDCRNGEDEWDCIISVDTANATDVPVTIEQLDMSTFQVYNPEVHAASTPQPLVKFIGFRRSDSGRMLDANTVVFKRKDKIVIYLHGYATFDLVDGLQIKEGLVHGTRDVDWVVLVDWRKLSLPSNDSSPTLPTNYKIVALQNVPLVAADLRRFLVTKLHRNNDVYLVGFSLGAHIAGTASRWAVSDGFTVNRISALDPAGPIFEDSFFPLFTVNTTNTLRPTDASFVDVIHASTMLGMINPAGHLDTYLTENECYMPSCTHHKSVEMYISSLTRCSLITCPKSGGCTSANFSSYGYLSDKYEGRGVHTLSVDTHYFGWKDKQCSEFMNAYLPAKHRVCHQTPNNEPNVVRQCKDKPYLSECVMNCPGNGESKSVCSTSTKVRIGAAMALYATGSGPEITTQTGGGGVTWKGTNCEVLSGCRDENNDPVDYFVVYKNPSSRYHVEYPNRELSIGAHEVTSENSVFGQTLRSIYTITEDDTTNFLVWNDDEKPDCVGEAQSLVDDDIYSRSSSNGHSKGMLSFNNLGGYLLIHSVPRFKVEVVSPYHYPDNGVKKAQMAVCVTLRPEVGMQAEYLTKLGTILDGLKTFKPQITSSAVSLHFDENVLAKMQNLTGKYRLGRPQQPVISNSVITPIFTLHFFGRHVNPGNHDTRYDAFARLAEQYRLSLKAQFWPNTRHTWSSNCDGQYTIENVRRVRVGGGEWNSTVDHSKWAVSNSQDTGVVCIGDLNRHSSTMSRGGMFICTGEQSLFETFRQFPISLEKCPSTEEMYY